TCDRSALYQGMCPVGLQCMEDRLSWLAVFTYFGNSFVVCDEISVYQLVVEFLDPLDHSVIDFFDFSAFKLHGQMPVSHWILGNHQTPRSFLIQSMAQLSIGGVCLG